MPGKVKLRFRTPTFNRTFCEEKVEKQSKILLRFCSRAWLKAAAKTIPTYTGTAKGTFKPMGRFLRVAVPIGSIRSNRTNKKVGGTTYQLGPTQGESYSSFDIQDAGPRYRLVFDQNLPWAVWNALGPGPPQLTQQTPWETYKRAQAAFFELLRVEAPKRLKDAYNESLGFKEIHA